MRKVVVILAAWAALVSGARAQVVSQSATPVLPTPPSPPLDPDEQSDGGSVGQMAAPKAKHHQPTIILLGKAEKSEPPGLRGAAQVGGRAAIVKVSGATLTAKLTLTGSAFSAVVCPGTCESSIRLVQPFAIKPGAGASPWVSVWLSGRAKGLFRTGENASSGLRLASVAISPAAGGPPLSLSLPPAGIGAPGHLIYCQDAVAPPAVLPAGCYVLMMDIAIEAMVTSHFHDYAGAAFSRARSGIQLLGNDPFRGLSSEDLGFTAVLKAESIAVGPEP
jgi:hypothetical protein